MNVRRAIKGAYGPVMLAQLGCLVLVGIQPFSHGMRANG